MKMLRKNGHGKDDCPIYPFLPKDANDKLKAWQVNVNNLLKLSE